VFAPIKIKMDFYSDTANVVPPLDPLSLKRAYPFDTHDYSYEHSPQPVLLNDQPANVAWILENTCFGSVSQSLTNTRTHSPLADLVDMRR
jgi:hypothetical protein